MNFYSPSYLIELQAYVKVRAKKIVLTAMTYSNIECKNVAIIDFNTWESELNRLLKFELIPSSTRKLLVMCRFFFLVSEIKI